LAGELGHGDEVGGSGRAGDLIDIGLDLSVLGGWCFLRKRLGDKGVLNKLCYHEGGDVAVLDDVAIGGDCEVLEGVDIGLLPVECGHFCNKLNVCVCVCVKECVCVK